MLSVPGFRGADVAGWIYRLQRGLLRQARLFDRVWPGMRGIMAGE